MKCIATFLLGCTLNFNVFAVDVSSIGHPEPSFSGQSSVTFTKRTLLKLSDFPKIQIELLNFRGGWQKGSAAGLGILEAAYVIPQESNALYQDLQSDDLGRRGQAKAILERVRTDAKFVGKDPDEAEQTILGTQRYPFKLSGEFERGLPNGVGLISYGPHVLKATFKDGYPEGLVTHLHDGKVVVAEFFERGRPSDGPVLINQYPSAGDSPSRSFVGQKTGGKVSGDWYEQFWGGDIPSLDYSRTGMGSTVTIVNKNGWTDTCEYDTSWLHQARATDLGHIRGTLPLLSLQVSDPMYLKSPKSCRAIDPQGWSFGYAVVGQGPFETTHSAPYTCNDPQGRRGVVSFPSKDTPLCEVTILTDRWGSKIGHKLEGIGKKLSTLILKPINKTGEAAFQTLCDVVHKEPGKNCHASMSYGKTFDIEDTPAQQKQRGLDELNTFLAARAALDKSPENSMRGEWLAAATIHEFCADLCTGAAKSYSMLSVRQIETLLKSAFDDDIKRRRVASVWDNAIEQLFRYLPLGEFAAETYAAKQLHDRIFDAQMVALNVPITEKNRYEILELQRFFGQLADREISRALLTVTSDALDLYPTIVFSKIPGLSNERQVGITRGFGLDPNKFFVKYREFKNSNEFIQTVIAEKFKAYNIEPGKVVLPWDEKPAP